MLISEVIDRYLSHAIAVGLWCPDALMQREQTFTLFKGALGHLDVSACQPYHLSDWIEANPGWRSTATRKARANQVNACFNWAASQRRIDSNPFKGVSYPEAEPRPCLPDATLEQVERLANKPFELAVRFLRLTGCRLSDLCRMTWADVDFERGIVILSKHKSRKKTGKPKIFVLVPEAVALLRLVTATEAGNGITAFAVISSAAVFRNTRGTPWNRRTLGQHLRRMKKRHGIETTASLHGIRHQAASAALKAGAPLVYVSRQLGHSSVVITQKIYGHVEQDYEQMRAAIEAGLPK